jgi:hypothetical protein
MYQIAVRFPIHGSRDEVIGSKVAVLPNTYETRGLPGRFVGRYSEESYGDGEYFVVDAKTGQREPQPAQVIDEDDIPF